MYWFDIPTELLPPVYQKIKDMNAYARSLDTELRGALADMLSVKSNFFIQTCDIETVEYWENLLEIPLYGGETVDERRQMILLYLNNCYPTSEPYVRHVLEDLYGAPHYSLSIDDDDPFKLRIYVYDTDYLSIRKFFNWFGMMCPAHLIWNFYHTELSNATNYISAGTTNHYSSTSECAMSTGIGTLYLGGTAYTVPWIELS